jgi:DNA-binding GntR family transcriptional regulator
MQFVVEDINKRMREEVSEIGQDFAGMPQFRGLEYESLSDKVYKELWTAIVTSAISAGTRLNVNKLSSQFGTSNTPVKEAVVKLRSEGLVHVIPRVGSFVTKHSVNDIKELFEARWMIETFIIDKIVQAITPDQMDMVKRMCDDMDVNVGENGFVDYFEYVKKEMTFHKCIVSLCGNAKITDIYIRLNCHVPIARTFYLRQASTAKEDQKQHKEIVRALEARDPKAFDEAIRRHTEFSRDLNLAILAELIRD